MKSIKIKYVVIVGAVIFLFTNFIACGAHFYKLSLEDDIDHKPAERKSAAFNNHNTAPGIHSQGGWKELPINFKIGASVQSQQLENILKAITTWEWVIGKKLFQYAGVHPGIDGDNFKDLYSSLPDYVNGHYLDFNWAKTGKKDVVLATTIWDNFVDNNAYINTADIRFNTQYYLLGDSLKLRSTPAKEIVDLESLALHELGHLLGLAHISEEMDSNSIMNPSLFIGEGLTSRRLSKGDMARIQQIYGCEGYACNIDQLFEQQEHNEKSNPSAQTSLAH